MMGLLPQLMKKAKKKGAKGAELLSPAAMMARFFNKGGDTMLKGGQKKLDKNKDGKISGEDFKMMKAKTGKEVDIDLMEKIAKQSLMGTGMLTQMRAASKSAKKKNMGGEILKARVGKSVESPGSKANKLKLSKQEERRAKLKKLREKGGGAAEEAKLMGNMKYMGGESKGYGAARTQGDGLSDENLIPGKSLDYHKDIL